ncbi:MAG: hypothetical protein ABR946_05740, partial [Solirubrobacteraceae bacterium]
MPGEHRSAALAQETLALETLNRPPLGGQLAIELGSAHRERAGVLCYASLLDQPRCKTLALKAFGVFPVGRP